MTKVYLSRCRGDAAEESRRILRAAPGISGPLLHTARGQPYLKDGPAVSISHTAGAAAAALGDSAVGVDLEHLRDLHPNLPARILSPMEYQWYASRGARAADFLTLWTLKESYYKYLGTGLPGYPNQTEFFREDGLWHLAGSSAQFHTWRERDLFLALCSDETDAELILFQS